jgi:hypothetical protein
VGLLIRFRIALSRKEFLSYYRGNAGWVQVEDVNGRKVRFPASWLRRFVDDDGVAGLFEMEVTPDNRLVDLRKIAG